MSNIEKTLQQAENDKNLKLTLTICYLLFSIVGIGYIISGICFRNVIDNWWFYIFSSIFIVLGAFLAVISIRMILAKIHKEKFCTVKKMGKITRLIKDERNNKKFFYPVVKCKMGKREEEFLINQAVDTKIYKPFSVLTIMLNPQNPEDYYIKELPINIKKNIIFLIVSIILIVIGIILIINSLNIGGI